MVPCVCEGRKSYALRADALHAVHQKNGDCNVISLAGPVMA